MITVGAFEAKTHLSTLLEQVERGEEVLITRRGKPIARMVPEKGLDRERTAAVIEQMKVLAKGCHLNELSVRELRDEGRE
jgi:prevent-host-death family protein